MSSFSTWRNVRISHICHFFGIRLLRLFTVTQVSGKNGPDLIQMPTRANLIGENNLDHMTWCWNIAEESGTGLEKVMSKVTLLGIKEQWESILDWGLVDRHYSSQTSKPQMAMTRRTTPWTRRLAKIREERHILSHWKEAGKCCAGLRAGLELRIKDHSRIPQPKIKPIQG